MTKREAVSLSLSLCLSVLHHHLSPFQNVEFEQHLRTEDEAQGSMYFILDGAV